MSFYIAKYGRVLALEGKMTEPPLDTTSLGFENHFEDKERAFFFRDRLREQHPRLFLNIQNKPTTTMSKKTMTQDDFREEMRRQVSQHMDEFWHNLSLLGPKEYVDRWLKAAGFGFSKAPTEKEPDELQQQEQQLKENKRKQDLISRGIITEDM